MRAAAAGAVARAASRLALALLPVLALCVWSTSARAHGASDAHLALDAAPRGASVRLDLALRDLDAQLGLDADGDGAITAGELRAREDDVARSALAAIRFEAAGRACRPGPVAHAVARRGDGAYAVLRFGLDCGGSAERLDVDYRLFSDLDAGHRALVSVAGGAGLQRLRPGEGIRRIALAADASSSPSSTASAARPPVTTVVADFVADGLRHILDGLDHLAFVLALAVAAVAVAARDARSLRATLADLLAVVTLFTLAHSLTLSMVATGWLALPSRLVETGIAASVAFAGIEVMRIARGHGSGTPRTLVFAFGLLHGCGFGSALADAGLGGAPAFAALLGFNLGVEAGQLLVLSVAFPVLWWLRGRRIHRRALQPAFAAVIVAAGVAWGLERAFDLPSIVQWARAAGG